MMPDESVRREFLNLGGKFTGGGPNGANDFLHGINRWVKSHRFIERCNAKAVKSQQEEILPAKDMILEKKVV